MKHQLSALLFCVVASLTFLSSCKKEMAALNENQAISPNLKRTVASRIVPIKGTYVTTNQFLAPPPMLLQRITGIGEASHLGYVPEITFW